MNPKLDALFGPVPHDIGRHSTLDGVRAIAILLLLLGRYAHAWPPLPGIAAVVERLVAQRVFVALILGAYLISLGSACSYRSGPGYKVEALLVAGLIVAAICAPRANHVRGGGDGLPDP